MQPTYYYPIKKLSGSLSKTHYASTDPLNPENSFIKRKPIHKKGWTKPASMVSQNANYTSALRAASRDYHDPVARARWQQEYTTWLKVQKRHRKSTSNPNQPRIRFLWDYIRWQYMSATISPPTPIGS